MIIPILLTVYAIAAFLLALYTLSHGVLLWQFMRHRTLRMPVDVPLQVHNTSYPHVTVQLPIYNEQHVALRLLDAIMALDYPVDKLHIQILDDSDDATTAMIAAHLRHQQTHHIDHIRRAQRVGYKAGALAYGLSQTDAPYVAIFDADFIPPPDFLLRTLPYLMDNPRAGVAQTRWGHLNPKANILTRAQVLSIDNHFIIEQTGRHVSAWFVPFNGTGGIWRAAAIRDAGGWSDDTLTEDLDLSFRAQLRGWQTVYLPHIIVPGELPPQLAAYRQQQARWAKGGSQAFRKLLYDLWRAELPLVTKLMATQPLVQYIPHLLMLVMLLLTPMLMLAGVLHRVPLAPIGIIGLVPPLMYIVSQRAHGGAWGKRLAAFPFLLLIGTGLIWQNALAVLAGFVQQRGEFRRTPKFVSDWQGSVYALRSQLAIVVQTVLMFYSLWGLTIAWTHDPALVPYFGLHVAAFGLVAIWDIIDQWRIAQKVSRPRLLPQSGND